jgi:hypothetical protein
VLVTPEAHGVSVEWREIKREKMTGDELRGLTGRLGFRIASLELWGCADG